MSYLRLFVYSSQTHLDYMSNMAGVLWEARAADLS